MDDEQTPLAIEQEALAIEADEPETEPGDDMEEDQSSDGFETEAQDDAEPAEAADEQPAEAVSDMVEVEINGKTYSVPAELKDGYLMQADYTRKTQEIAENRRKIEAEKASIDRLKSVSQDELNARALSLSINQKLAEYSKVDWNAWDAQDPIAANTGWREYTQLKENAQQVATYLQRAEAERSQAARQDTVKRYEETAAYAKKEIPGWSQEFDVKLEQYATQELGFTPDELMGMMSPRVYRALHRAWVGEQTLKAGGAKKPAAPQIKPLKTVSAKTSGTTTKAPHEMSMDEYARYAKKRFGE